MKKRRSTLLQWQLVRRLILLQTETLFAFVGSIWLVLLLLESRLLSNNETALEVMAGAVSMGCQRYLCLA